MTMCFQTQAHNALKNNDRFGATSYMTHVAESKYSNDQGTNAKDFVTHVPLRAVPVQSLIEPVIAFPAGL